jgi:hypothetical protein
MIYETVIELESRKSHLQSRGRLKNYIWLMQFLDRLPEWLTPTRQISISLLKTRSRLWNRAAAPKLGKLPDSGIPFDF